LLHEQGASGSKMGSILPVVVGRVEPAFDLVGEIAGYDPSAGRRAQSDEANIGEACHHLVE
jgi:hypothetical protein